MLKSLATMSTVCRDIELNVYTRTLNIHLSIYNYIFLTIIISSSREAIEIQLFTVFSIKIKSLQMLRERSQPSTIYCDSVSLANAEVAYNYNLYDLANSLLLHNVDQCRWRDFKL